MMPYPMAHSTAMRTIHGFVVVCILLALSIALPRPLAATETPEIIFVHGNGDDAAKWIPVIWLFESNGYPADKLHAIRMTNPSARGDDTKPQAYRSSTVDQVAELSAFVSRVLLTKGARRVVLVGSSRGGLTIRNYLKNAGGAAVTSHAILCGTPNHGVYALPMNLGNEFNGKGPFIEQLNTDSEVVDGVRFLTLRSDRLDKYAQPDGRAAGMPIERTGVEFDGPALEGAENLVLPGLDHREVAFHPQAFAAMYRFLTGKEPTVLAPIAEATPLISGLVTGFAGGAATNLPMAGVRLRIFPLRPGSAAREAEPAYDAVTDETGSWGPLRADPKRHYEFLLEAEGRTVSIFKSPLLRTTALLNLRFYPAPRNLPADRPALLVQRPQGYFAKERDPLTINGREAEGLAPGVPTADFVPVALPEAPPEGLRVELRGEVIYARPSRLSEGHFATAELFYE